MWSYCPICGKVDNQYYPGTDSEICQCSKKDLRSKIRELMLRIDNQAKVIKEQNEKLAELK